MTDERHLATLAVHAGERGPKPDFTPVTTPIYHSVGYLYDRMDDMDAVFGGRREGFVYPRYGSPTVAAFERAMAALEGAPAAVAYSSGMAAMHAALLGAGVRAGTRAVAAADVYGATYALLDTTMRTLGVETRFVDITQQGEVQQAVREAGTVALVCEAISNPLLKVADVPALATIAHGAGAALIVDNTFATPYLLRPLAHGADYVVHSATKYIGGHGDLLAGIVACDADRAHDLRERQKLLGANLGPQEAWMALRGLKTLVLRVREQCTNAQIVAQWLVAHPRVERVHYPGLCTHPQYALAAELYGGGGYGGMVSFVLRGATRDDVLRFMERLRLVLPATTLGDVQSLCLYPAMSSHRALAPEVRAALGISDALVRLSIGIEDARDIIADLEQALKQV